MILNQRIRFEANLWWKEKKPKFVLLECKIHMHSWKHFNLMHIFYGNFANETFTESIQIFHTFIFLFWCRPDVLTPFH